MTRARPRITPADLTRLNALYGPVAARLHEQAARLDISPMSEDEYHVWTDADERAERACGGYGICPGCGCRSLRTAYMETRQYGGGLDSYEVCTISCGFQEVHVMKSITTLTEPVNGRRDRKTIIGTITLEEPITRKVTYETASWYTLVDIPAGEYDVWLLATGSVTWAMIGYKGIITKEYFVNRVFWSSSVHEPTENIGKERRATGTDISLHCCRAIRKRPSLRVSRRLEHQSRGARV